MINKNDTITIKHNTFRKAMKELKGVSGVYAWFLGSKCIYIGATVNLGWRATRIFWTTGDCGERNNKMYALKKKNPIEKISIMIALCPIENLTALEYLMVKVSKLSIPMEFFVPYSIKPCNKTKR